MDWNTFLHNFGQGFAVVFIVGWKAILILLVMTIIGGILRRRAYGKHANRERYAHSFTGERDRRMHDAHAAAQLRERQADRYSITRQNVADRYEITRIMDEHARISQNR